MTTWRCNRKRTAVLLCLTALLVFLVASRRNARTHASLERMRSLLRPAFAPSGRMQLTPREALDACVLAARQYCSERQPDEHAAPRRWPGQTATWSRSQSRLHWCGHPATVTTEIADSLQHLAEENSGNEIRIEEGVFLSMANSNSSVLSWNIVEHPLVMLIRIYTNLRQTSVGWAPLARLLPPGPVSLRAVAELALDAAAGPTAHLLRPAVDVCHFCATHYDFVLHAGELDVELPHLLDEIGWSSGQWDPPTRASYDQALSEAVRLVPTLPVPLMVRLKQHYAADLDLYGFEFDVDAIYRALA
ncbi:uncharacterized protein LOC119110540 [Pollicipes pollicipes]|uniref:uncharacterized protein LOC119110540 n=1 Tax=Pollicipes pollicipes TaxID=41117 RepID=UPI001884F6BB|nr:uncharacterized protein LOC119110540 [Pollicipes pollicipes]